MVEQVAEAPWPAKAMIRVFSHVADAHDPPSAHDHVLNHVRKGWSNKVLAIGVIGHGLNIWLHR